MAMPVMTTNVLDRPLSTGRQQRGLPGRLLTSPVRQFPIRTAAGCSRSL